MYRTLTHYTPAALIRRTRTLPLEGDVLVKIGQKVQATEIIAEAPVPSRHTVVDLAQSLGLRDVARVRQALKRQVGESVQQGDVLAEVRGLFTRVVRAPADGSVVALAEGKLVLEEQSDKLRLRAGLPGIVTELIPTRGAVITSQGLLIQGVWGNGQVDSGPLRHLEADPQAPLEAAALDVSLRGAVLLAGACGDSAALRAALDLPVRGLILGSLAPELLALAETAAQPIILLEGFGGAPIHPVVYQLLAENLGQEATLSATPWDPGQGERPEVFIAQGQEAQPLEDKAELEVGRSVRLLSAPHFGEIGTVVELRRNEHLPNGVRAAVAMVQLEDQERVGVPIQNLELMDL